MVLDKERYDDWQQLAAAYTDYVADVGPWTQREIVAFFTDDFGINDAEWPFSRTAIARFFQSSERMLSSEVV